MSLGLSGGASLQELPDETLLQICQELDVPTLIKTAKTYRRLNNICGEVIKERKEDYLLDYQTRMIMIPLEHGINVFLNLKDKAYLHGVDLESNLILSKYGGKVYTAELKVNMFAGSGYLSKIWPFQQKPRVWESLAAPVYRGILVTDDVEIIKQGIKKALKTGFKLRGSES